MNRFLLDDSIRLDGAGAATSEPRWSMLFPLGTRHRRDFPGGKIEFTAEMLGTMLANWKAAGGPARQVNYFHRGASDGDATPIDDKVAAGWIEEIELRADGLWGRIKWTDRARAYIAKDELRYLSPEFAMAYQDRRTGKNQGPTLLGAALLNDPFLAEMPRVAASDNPQPPEDTMNRTLIPALFALLSLKNDATEAQVEEAAKKMAEDRQALSDKVTTLADTTKKLSDAEAATVKLAADLKTANEKNAELVEKLAAQDKAAHEAKAEAFVAKLRDEGKILPAQFDAVKATALLNLSSVEAMFKDAKPVVALSEVGISGRGTSADEKKQEEAAKRFNLAVDEKLAKGGLSYMDAYNLVKIEKAEDFALAFTEAPKTGATSTTA